MKEGDGLSPEPQQYKQTKEQRENNMKIKNLAFCGVMASILGMGGAYAADATIIASKAYVDARDNTKQDNSDRITTTWAAASATDQDSTTKYPSMKTLGSAIQAGATDAINALNLSTNGQTGVIKTVSQTNGQVAVTSGTVNTNDITDSAVTNGKIADSAVTAAKLATNAVETDKIKNDAVTTAKIADGNVTMPKTDFVVKQGNSEKAWNEASETGETEAERTLAKAAKDEEKDKYVPTLSAVESRITAAVGAGTSELNGNNADSATGTSEGVTNEANKGMAVVKVSETAGIVTATLGAIGTAGLQDNAVTNGKIANNAVTTDKLQDGAVTTDKIADSTITNSDISTAAAITTNKMGAITDYTISTATGAARNLAATDTLNEALGKLEKKADDNANTVSNLDLTEVREAGKPIVAVKQENGQVDASAGTISYSAGLDYKLSEINTNGGDGSQGCTKRSPCTLTMVMDNGKPVYEWTNMETDGLDGVL